MISISTYVHMYVARFCLFPYFFFFLKKKLILMYISYLSLAMIAPSVPTGGGIFSCFN